MGVMLAIVYYLFCKALEVGNVTIVSPITSFWALITAVLGILLLNETSGLIKLISIIMVITGVTLLSINWEELQKKNFLTKGVEYAILVSLGWGVVFFYSGPLTREMGWFNTTLASRFIVALVLGSIFILSRGHLELKKLEKFPWKLLLLVGCLDVIAYSVYNLAVSKYEVSYVSVISSASPLITVILASIIFKENTNKLQKIGITLSILGIIGLQI